MRIHLLTLALTIPAVAATAQRGVKLDNFTYQSVEFAAPSLEKVWADYGIYLPKGYDDDANAKKTYPWAIWLHGLRGDASRFQYGAAKVLDRLRGDDEIPEMIVVAPSAGRMTSYFNGEPDGDYEDLIVDDLIKSVEKKYRVSRRRTDRAIMGISMGGFGAFRLAFKHPDVFGAVAAHSSAMFPADPKNLSQRYARSARRMASILGDPIDAEVWAREIPTAMVAKMKPADLASLRIYFDVGDRDRYQFAPPNQEFHEVLEKAGVEHTFVLVKGGGHSWNSGLKDSSLEASFMFVGKSFARAGAKDAAGAKDKNDKDKTPR